MAKERLQAEIYGDVQMVGFRAFASRHARSLKLSGYVRNRPDGSVEVAAEGERASLEDFLSELRRGPNSATVENVEVSWQQPTDEFSGFHIAY